MSDGLQEFLKRAMDMTWLDARREYLSGFCTAPQAEIDEALRILDCYERVDSMERPTTDDLEPLVKAAGPPNSAAQDCFHTLMNCSQYKARWFCLYYINFDMPKRLKVKLIEQSLSDRSGKVRQRGAEKACQFRLKQLLPKIEMLAVAEKDEADAEYLKRKAQLLRDGSRVYWNADTDGKKWWRVEFVTPFGSWGDHAIDSPEEAENEIRKTILNEWEWARKW